MWRTLIFKAASSKRVAVRSFANTTAGQKDIVKTGSKNQNSKNETGANQDGEQPNENKEDFSEIGKAVIKTLVCLHLLRDSVKKENTRVELEEQVDVLGKRGSGVELVCKSLLSTYSYERYKQGLLRNQNELHINEQNSKRPSEVTGFNQQHQRKVRLTCLYSDEITSVTPDPLSSFWTAEDNSAVFCFHLSYRFTEEDENLLETYLKNRKREDMKGIKVVFTYYGSLDVDIKDYIDKLPDKFKNFLRKCDDKYCFISSSDKLSKEAEEQVKDLVKPIPSFKFYSDIVQLTMVYLFPSLVFAVK